ncbi:hypothetical protein NVV93_08585 [Pseudomonas sp. LS44]|uniref:hypothetical protein n=1 Tax=Pseudomonas sp. LS44 TaxID=1357074 RepID=UPI00215B5F39|nr:hypothetical protein [Pseudomonas sp. LS44]UVE19415.1 hypothetical protein NVV93_08585 [Pseudomonas sp. LS44]
MSEAKRILKAIQNFTTPELEPAPTLDAKASLLGYPDFQELENHLLKLEKQDLLDTEADLLQKICTLKNPNANYRYFKFHAHSDRDISYSSIWIGKNEYGSDVRIPALVDAYRVLENFKLFSDLKIVIVDDFHEALIWNNYWLGDALIREDVARDYFFELFQRESQIKSIFNKEPSLRQ